MCIALVGGMDRLKSEYEKRAGEYGVRLCHFKRGCPRFAKRLANMDAIVIFTNKVSHNAKRTALARARAGGIPVVMCHSCGLKSLERCLECIMKVNFKVGFTPA